MTTLLAGLEENSSSPANLSHCHPGSTCTLRCLINLAWGLLKQLGLRLLYRSFFIKFPCWLSYKWEFFVPKVIGDVEVADNVARTVPCQGQGSASQRVDKGGAPRQLRKRKKLLGREWCFFAKKKKITFIALTMSLYLRAHKEKYTFCRTCRLISNTCDHLTSTPFLAAVCLTEFTQVHPLFCSLRVPSCWASRRTRVRLQFCTARLMISKQRKR